jgi:hypothetical protein
VADLTTLPWNEWPVRCAPQDQVSAHFRFYELTASELAQRQGIPNLFESAAQVHAAVYLCRKVLQPLRDVFGRFTPNSVYRSQALERALKGRPKDWTSGSQHCLGEACDVEIPGIATLDLARWASQHIEFDQIICECYDPAQGANAGWVHISLRPPGGEPNRKELLSYVRDARSGQFIYVAGLQPGEIG